jgi:hypothetical protein
MPLLSSVLAKLSEQLRDNGAVVAHRPLELVAAIASFLEAATIRLDDEVAAAAFACALLAPADAQRAVEAVGIPLRLVPKGPSIETDAPVDDMEVVYAIECGDRQQATVAAALLFSRYWFAASTGDGARLKSLRGYIDILRSGCTSPYQDVVQTLIVEIDKAKIAQPPAPQAHNYVFSISIDLVGSTQAKARVMKVADGDLARIDELNSEIYSGFCRIEAEFYKAATNRYSNIPPISPDRFFAVKGIGDEFWIMCELAPTEVMEVGNRLINAAIEIAANTVDLLATQHKDGPRFDRNFDYGRIEPVTSPVKIFVDLLKHASNLGATRDAILAKTIPTLLQQFYERDPTQSEITKVTRNLGLATFEPFGVAAARSYRTDYRGHEIDRFFRATKTMLPGVVMIGETMAKEMRLEFLPYENGIFSVQTSDHIPLRAGKPEDPLYCIGTPPEEWKGIDYLYSTYGLFAPRSLMGFYVNMEGIKKSYHSDTAKRVSRSTLDKIVNEIIPKAT